MIAVANHLWQSTLFAFLAWGLTLTLRRNRASVRCWIWLAASVKFLIPFALFVALGSRIEWREAPVSALPAAIPVAIEQISQPFTTAAARAENTPSAAAPPVAVLLPIWGCGFMAIALRWGFKWRSVKAAARAGSPLALDVGIPVISSPALLEPGVFGIRRPVLLLGDGILARLTPQQFSAVIAHELCHVRRRDNLAAAVHMIVEAIFWFHPVVWWIGTRMMEERERACDEDVLRLGNEPRVYAESILKVCEIYLESPLECVAGVTGANLKERIRTIMARRVTHKLDAGRKLLLAAAGMTAICGPIFFGLVNAPRGRAQSKAVEFEVASVRPGDPSGGDNSGFKMAKENGGGGSGFELEHRRLTIRNFNLYALVVHAYGLKSCRPFGMEGGCPVLSGGPDWLQKGGFDIVAKMPDDSPDYMVDIVHFLIGGAPQVHLAMQALLVDRFHLKVHREMKPLPVFAFTVSKKGSKLKKAEGGDAKIFFRGGTGPNGERIIHLIGTNSTMQELADMYTKFMDRPVVDQTDLKDRFDFTVDYEVNTESAGPFKELSSPSLFKALEEQAGLKLEATKAPVEILVIDHAEKPTAN